MNMPYYVYHIEIHPETKAKKLRHLETFDQYKQARALAREGRSKLTPGSNEDVRLIHAKSDTEAEKLLSIPRDERVIGED